MKKLEKCHLDQPRSAMSEKIKILRATCQLRDQIYKSFTLQVRNKKHYGGKQKLA